MLWLGKTPPPSTLPNTSGKHGGNSLVQEEAPPLSLSSAARGGTTLWQSSCSHRAMSNFSPSRTCLLTGPAHKNSAAGRNGTSLLSVPSAGALICWGSPGGSCRSLQAWPSCGQSPWPRCGSVFSGAPVQRGKTEHIFSRLKVSVLFNAMKNPAAVSRTTFLARRHQLGKSWAPLQTSVEWDPGGAGGEWKSWPPPDSACSVEISV